MHSVSEKKLFMLGCTHKSAGLDEREQFALTSDKQQNLYKELLEQDEILEVFILNTCNRIELYCVSKSDRGMEIAVSAFARVHGKNLEEVLPHIVWMRNQDVVRHLFEVATGIDSQMVGEVEILGQVKVAYREASESGVLGPILNRIIQKSFQAAKWSRTNTGIGQGHISIGSVTAELAIRIFGDIFNTKILILGGGEAGEKTLQAMHSRGATNTTIANRTFHRALELSKKYQGNVIHYECFPLLISHYDIVVCSTASPQIIIDEQMIRSTLRKRPNQSLFLVDLSVPRNICASASKVSNAYLYNMDDLSHIANENMKAREAEVLKCHKAFDRKVPHHFQALNIGLLENDFGLSYERNVESHIPLESIVS